MPDPEYFRWMLVGYLITIAVETTVLVLGLSRRHSVRVRVFAGVWLTACTYPVVWIMLPPLQECGWWLYLLVAETFAPAAECAIFWLAFIRPLSRREHRPVDNEAIEVPPLPAKGNLASLLDFTTITLANLCSFGLGEVLRALGLWG